MCLGTEMGEGVNALANKMEPLGFSLIIEKLELDDPFKKMLVCEFELSVGDPVLVDDSDGDHQLTVVSIVHHWEYPIE